MNRRFLILLVLLLVGVPVANSMFRVQQWEQALVFKFGKIDRVVTTSGLHFKIPFIQKVRRFELRVNILARAQNQKAQRFLTQEKKDLIVDYYAVWRISDAAIFYTATRGDTLNAGRLITQRVNRALRDEFGKRTLQEVVADERGEVMSNVMSLGRLLGEELGVELLDVRTVRIDLPAEVSNSVYARMRAERQRVAKDFRARGEEAAERIRATADRNREVILAEAYREAEITRGEGDAKAASLYAKAFLKDPEFYRFYRSLFAYRESFKDGRNVMVLDTESDFFRYFNDFQIDQGSAQDLDN